MGMLREVVRVVGAFNHEVERKAREARENAVAREQVLAKWADIQAQTTNVVTPTGLQVPRLALPLTDDPAEIVRYLEGEGLPGRFPFLSGAYREMYLFHKGQPQEEPTRMFAGLGLAEDTNARFRFLSRNQKTIRLSTAFDGPTLYGLDSDHEGVFGKIGEGGVAVDTIDDMARLYDGFDLTDRNFSVSLTINGPAPIILAMYVAAAAKKALYEYSKERSAKLTPEEEQRIKRSAIEKLRGTIQSDIFKEVQAQNECLFPLDASLRLLGDMTAYCLESMPKWYPISISGYHIAEAGATPVQQAAFTLANGFTYLEKFSARGMDPEKLVPRLSFFLSCGEDLEYAVLGRVCRKIWAVGLRDHFGISPEKARFKFHTQTSGRTLTEQVMLNNISRTAVQMFLAFVNNTNSSHSNSYDEPCTTPSRQAVKVASDTQAILLEETGLFQYMMNLFVRSPGLQALEREVERAVLAELEEIDRIGGVIAGIEQRYFRNKIQHSAYKMQRQIDCGERPVVGVNKYRSESEPTPALEPQSLSYENKRKQIERTRQFKQKHSQEATTALARLKDVMLSGGNSFQELIATVEHATLGQIVQTLHEAVGYFRPSI